MQHGKQSLAKEFIEHRHMSQFTEEATDRKGLAAKANAFLMLHVERQYGQQPIKTLDRHVIEISVPMRDVAIGVRHFPSLLVEVVTRREIMRRIVQALSRLEQRLHRKDGVRPRKRNDVFQMAAIGV